MSNPKPTIDDILLKPARWQFDDYQKAKKELVALIRGCLPDKYELPDVEKSTYSAIFHHNQTVDTMQANLRKIGIE